MARRRGEPAGEVRRVAFIELFFDLVFVFAITQLSHLLLEDLSWSGAAEAGFLLLAVWSTWVFAVWWSSWSDTEADVIRVELVGAMLACMLMAVAIPEAFGGRAVLFASGYLAVRLLLATSALATSSASERARVASLWVWTWAAAPIWLAGAFLDGDARVAVWIVALAVDYTGPVVHYWTPRLDRFVLADAEIAPHHLAERFQLFVIIVLGESIVLTGVTATDLDMSASRIVAIVVAVLVAAVIWRLYFGRDERLAQSVLARAGEGRHVLARDAYTYLHIPIVAGLILVAVASELVIAHPDDELPDRELIALASGPVLFLLGSVAVVVRALGRLAPARLVAAAGVVAAALLGTALPALATWALVLGVLGTLVAIDIGQSRRDEAAPAR